MMILNPDQTSTEKDQSSDLMNHHWVAQVMKDLFILKRSPIVDTFVFLHSWFSPKNEKTSLPPHG